MQPEFWQQRWQEGRIGFHQSAPTALLQKHWPELGIAPSTKVFVPLCGKSLDLTWLAARGHRVLGVELTQTAVDQFFAEHGLRPEVHDSRYGRHHRAGAIEILRGDVFDLDAEALADCGAVFDRAALIALPPAMRERYVREVYGALPAACTGLLITLDYPQQDRDGPPFSVPEAEVRDRFAHGWEVALRERRAIPKDHPGYVGGASSLDTAVYGLRRTTAAQG